MGREAVRPLGIVGNLNVDLWVHPVRRFPEPDEELLVEGARVEFAGTAGYVMLAAAGLGLPTLCVSTVGDDLFGRYIVEHAAALGMDTAGVEVLAGRETSLGMIFVRAGGGRGILSTLGAHAEMDVGVAERHDEELAACPEVLLCGNYLIPGLAPALVAPYARRLRERGRAVVFDPGWDPAGWTEETRAGTYALLPHVDVYMPNEEEGIHLTGAADWRGALDELAARVAGEIVLKRGAAGAVWARGDERVEVSGHPVEAVNTVGAGDVFDAGYLYARRRGWDPEQRLRFANALAAHVISQSGARTYPAAEAVAAFAEARPG